MLKRKQNGFVIEMMIVFMLVTFGLCMAITIHIQTLNVDRKSAKQTIHMQTDLNQIGEYYLRYIEESGEQFPTGKEANFSATKYKWLDDEAKTFFTNCNQKYHFTYEPAFSITRGSMFEFFKTKYIWRKLVVKDEHGAIRMVVELKEKRVSNNQTEYYIQNWAVGDELIDESAESGGYQTDNLNLLQKLWKFLGLEITSLQTWEPSGDLSDLRTFFGDLNSNWREAMSNGAV